LINDRAATALAFTAATAAAGAQQGGGADKAKGGQQAAEIKLVFHRQLSREQRT
jgi:hypothetical protein